MFTPIKNKRVYEHVIEQIQTLVLEDRLGKGDKLPSERELASQLGVSRTSIREALRSLEISGLIESRQGEGTFIKEKVEEGFFQPLTVMFMLNKDKREDILELRTTIEIGSAYLAAKRITQKDEKELKNLLDNMKNSDNEKDRAKYDTLLHYKIAQISGNYFMVSLLNGISMLMESFIVYAREKILTAIDDEDLLIRHHENICNAIIANDPIKASDAMRTHLELIFEHLAEK
ncbi:FadR/GntR family transcriptional regulator [Sporosalibacterium faouarense]|uniref:FadR/GntR family transcriptional regulator n=1 Tax=Sporosalibacterium faouarense TaxID=516123 RepID=UPI00141C3BD4|nr:FadR/GntR family transcriptional regulator [Sporosalibacterium faouarense]MTI47086.1 FadR family transcriptional regulator [Bacillota bacterium]